MRCFTVRRRLLQYQDGNLAAEQRAQVERHLRDCPACAREHARLRATTDLVEALPEVDPPPDFTANVLKAIAAPTRQADRARQPMRPAVSPRFAALLGTAGLLLSAIIVASVLVTGITVLVGGATALAPVTAAMAKTLCLGLDVGSVIAGALVTALGKPLAWLLIADVVLLSLLAAARKHLVQAVRQRGATAVLAA